MAGAIVCCRGAWAALSGLAAQSLFAAQSCAFLCLWPMKSMWSHWESVCPGRSARGTHHAEMILDWLPWGVISHLLTQWGFVTTTTEIHSFVYGCCPCCGQKNPFHLSQIPLTFHNQSSTWDNCPANYVTFSLEKRQGKTNNHKTNFCFNKLNLWVRNQLFDSNCVK